MHDCHSLKSAKQQLLTIMQGSLIEDHKSSQGLGQLPKEKCQFPGHLLVVLEQQLSGVLGRRQHDALI